MKPFTAMIKTFLACRVCKTGAVGWRIVFFSALFSLHYLTTDCEVVEGFEETVEVQTVMKCRFSISSVDL